MAKICFDFTGEKFWFDEADLLGLLKNIEAKPKLVKLSHKNDLWNIINTPENKKKYYGSYFCFLDDEKYLKAKELLFFYHVRDIMINKNIWISMDAPSLDNQSKNELKKRAEAYGRHRYSVDNGWIGVLAQDLFEKYLDRMEIKYDSYPENAPKGIDEYDILINNYKLDVKCATQDNYMEITPKASVELETPKDFYIAMKYYSDIEKFVIIGYFDHTELANHPFKVLYGTAYWGVKLYSAKPLSNLLSRLKNE